MQNMKSALLIARELEITIVNSVIQITNRYSTCKKNKIVRTGKTSRVFLPFSVLFL